MLPKFRRLNRRDLNLCNNTGKVLRFPHFLLKILPNSLEYSRFAIVTSTKLSKSAVIRNKLRRNIYKAIGNRQQAIGTDVIFFPQKSMLKLDNNSIGIEINKVPLEIK